MHSKPNIHYSSSRNLYLKSNNVFFGHDKDLSFVATNIATLDPLKDATKTNPKANVTTSRVSRALDPLFKIPIYNRNDEQIWKPFSMQYVNLPGYTTKPKGNLNLVTGLT